MGLCICIPAHSQKKDDNHLSQFKFLLENNLLFYGEINNDSLITWEKQLTRKLKVQQDQPLYFSLKYMAALAYGMQGDVNTAAEYSKQMFEEAKQMNSGIGRIMAYATMADSYYHSHMYVEAIESYYQANELAHNTLHAETVMTNILPRHIVSLLHVNRISDARKYLQELDQLSHEVPASMLNFVLPLTHAIYEIRTDSLEDAEEYLAEAGSAVEESGFEYHAILLQQARAVYYEKKGDYAQALDLYTQLEKASKNQSIVRAIDYTIARAHLLTLLGNSREACLIYQDVYAKQDSLTAQSYVRQMNETRVRYYVDQIEIENRAERNNITKWSIIAVSFILVVIIFFALRISKQTKKLIQSKELLEKAKSSAESAIRTKSILLSNMSHEIRTPLNALSGFSTILTEENIDDETRRQCNDIILQNSELLLKLINDVIDMSNLELGMLEFTLKRVDAISICRNVIDTVERVKQTQAAILFHTDLESLELYTDDLRLQQVLINILINATKFTPSGSITLEISKQSEQVALFTVTDTGSGIPLSKQGQIFNRFEKLNEGAQGTGLGLSISQLIIERLGGEIWIDAEYTGGARFRFTHPIEGTEQGKEEEA